MSTSTVQIGFGFADGAVASPKVAIFRRELGSEAWKRVGIYYTADGSAKLDDLLIGTTYDIAVAPVGNGDKIAPETAWEIVRTTPQGLINTPPAPTNFTATQDGDRVDLEWDGVKEKMRDGDFYYYEIRRGSAWKDSVLLFKIDAEKAGPRWATSGAQTYRIRAVDKKGNVSSEVTASITVIALEQHSEETSVDEDGSNWAGGTHTGTQVNGSNELENVRWGATIDAATDTIDDATWLVWGPYERDYEGAEVDLGATKTVRLEADYTVEVDAPSTTIDQEIQQIRLPRVSAVGVHLDRTDESSYFDYAKNRVIDAETRPAGARVEIELDRSGTWRRYVPGVYRFRYISYRVLFFLWDRRLVVRMPRFRFKALVRNLKDEGTITVAASPGPTAITFGVPFNDAPKVVAGSTEAGHTVIAENITNSGADLRLYDETGTEAFVGDVTWIAAGT